MPANKPRHRFFCCGPVIVWPRDTLKLRWLDAGQVVCQKDFLVKDKAHYGSMTLTETKKGFELKPSTRKNAKIGSKMSKSRGNVVLVDEVVRGVCELAPGYDFRGLDGQLVDWEFERVWFLDSVGYFTSTQCGRRPVFLHEADNPVPMSITRLKTVQHVKEIAFWQNLFSSLDFSE